MVVVAAGLGAEVDSTPRAFERMSRGFWRAEFNEKLISLLHQIIKHEAEARLASGGQRTARTRI